MKHVIKLVALAAIIGLSGCASIPYGGSVSVQNVDYPTVGTVTTAFVGDHLVEKGTITQNGALTVLSPINGVAYNIPARTYTQIGSNSEGDFYSAIGVTKNPFVDPISALCLGKQEDAKLCVATPFSNAATCYEGQWRRDTVTSEAGKNFQQTLIYSGRIGDKLNISYREFSGGRARDAFTNSIEYDLSVSTTIGYKGAVIEVIEADNRKIVYKLVRNFR